MNNNITSDAFNCELHIPSIQEVKGINPITGKFLKGHIPFNEP